MSDKVWLVPPDRCSSYVRQANYLLRAALLLSQLRYVTLYKHLPGCCDNRGLGYWCIVRIGRIVVDN